MKALTVRQPWAWLLAAGHKTLENRSWLTKHRGPLLIHAACRLADDHERIRQWARTELGILIPKDLPLGGIVGQVSVLEMLTEPVQSPWWIGPRAWRVGEAMHLPFRPLKGKLQLFEA